jgi:peptidoglycan/xylan/chitin deacetylase (PgdA/CDA1 family)
MKKIALTFDDGPTKETTQLLLDTMKKHNAHATWMLWGEHVRDEPELAKAIVDGGHEIGNHSYTHPDLAALSPREINEQISKTDSAISDVLGGLEAHFIRPPMGSYDEQVINTVDRPLIIWTIDSGDWDHKDATKTRNAILGNTNDGDIILLHDWVPSTAEILDDIMTGLENEGVEFVTISQLLGDKLKGAKVVRGLNDIEY